MRGDGQNRASQSPRGVVGPARIVSLASPGYQAALERLGISDERAQRWLDSAAVAVSTIVESGRDIDYEMIDSLASGLDEWDGLDERQRDARRNAVGRAIEATKANPGARAADVVAIAEGRVLLIRRLHPPFAGSWALPGGHVDDGEEFADAARRELEEETGITVDDITEIGTYDAPGRDPRREMTSGAYLTRLERAEGATAADDADEAEWHPLDDLPELAFDHDEIIADATRG